MSCVKTPRLVRFADLVHGNSVLLGKYWLAGTGGEGRPDETRPEGIPMESVPEKPGGWGVEEIVEIITLWIDISLRSVYRARQPFRVTKTRGT
jgi:hypothetical protein